MTAFILPLTNDPRQVMTLDLNPDDACLVIFSDVDSDNWFETGEASAPNSPRRHSLSDGFAFVGFRIPGNPGSGGSFPAFLFRKEVFHSVSFSHRYQSRFRLNSELPRS